MLGYTRMKKCRMGVYLSIKEELSGVRANKKKERKKKLKIVYRFSDAAIRNIYEAPNTRDI